MAVGAEGGDVRRVVGSAVGEPAQVVHLQVWLARGRDERRRPPSTLADAVGE